MVVLQWLNGEFGSWLVHEFGAEPRMTDDCGDDDDDNDYNLINPHATQPRVTDAQVPVDRYRHHNQRRERDVRSDQELVYLQQRPRHSWFKLSCIKDTRLFTCRFRAGF